MKGFPNRSYYGKSHVATTRDNGSATATKKQNDSFNQEYQQFIEDLKTKKEETPVITDEPKVEAEVIPETVKTVAEDAPVLNEKKTKKKKAEPVAEPTIDGLD